MESAVYEFNVVQLPTYLGPVLSSLCQGVGLFGCSCFVCIFHAVCLGIFFLKGGNGG